MVTYNVHIGNAHLLDDALKEKTKRNILIEGLKLEEVDRMTALFPSFKELEEELNPIPEPNDIAVIMLLDKYNEGIKIVTRDIVYSEDIKEIYDRDSIKNWTIDYLKKHPTDIRLFDGIRATYSTIYGKNDIEYSEQKVEYSIHAYFNNAGYSTYRKTYFTLKSIDIEKYKNKNK